MADRSGAYEATRLVQIIFDYARVIGREQDRDALIKISGDMGRDLVGADRCTIWLIDDQKQQVVAHFAHGSQLMSIALGEGLVGSCVATGEVILSNSPLEDHRFSAAVDRQTGYTTMNVLTVPMRAADGRIIGAFQAVNKPGGFVPTDAGLLQLAAAYSAWTIETQMLLRIAEGARRVTRDLEIAREVQQRLLAGSQRHHVSGLDFVALCRPATEVGGDYYDVMPLPTGEIAIAVGDVSGKGIAAALMMTSIQATLRGLVLQEHRGPADLVSELNAAIINAATGQYLTLFFAVYDPNARVLRAVNAGHVYPLVMTPGGRVHEFKIGGAPLGLFPHVDYEQEEWRLGQGDVLVCYSDGLTEAQNPSGQLWGECGFRDAVMAAAGLPAKEMIVRVMRAADQFTNGTLSTDDMTLVCFRVTA